MHGISALLVAMSSWVTSSFPTVAENAEIGPCSRAKRVSVRLCGLPWARALTLRPSLRTFPPVGRKLDEGPDVCWRILGACVMRACCTWVRGTVHAHHLQLFP